MPESPTPSSGSRSSDEGSASVGGDLADKPARRSGGSGHRRRRHSDTRDSQPTLLTSVSERTPKPKSGSGTSKGRRRTSLGASGTSSVAAAHVIAMVSSEASGDVHPSLSHSPPLPMSSSPSRSMGDVLKVEAMPSSPLNVSGYHQLSSDGLTSSTTSANTQKMSVSTPLASLPEDDSSSSHSQASVSSHTRSPVFAATRRAPQLPGSVSLLSQSSERSRSSHTRDSYSSISRDGALTSSPLSPVFAVAGGGMRLQPLHEDRVLYTPLNSSSALGVIVEDEVFQSTTPRHDSSESHSSGHRPFSPRYSSALSSPATSGHLKRSMLLQAMGRAPEVDMAPHESIALPSIDTLSPGSSLRSASSSSARSVQSLSGSSVRSTPSASASPHARPAELPTSSSSPSALVRLPLGRSSHAAQLNESALSTARALAQRSASPPGGPPPSRSLMRQTSDLTATPRSAQQYRAHNLRRRFINGPLQRTPAAASHVPTLEALALDSSASLHGALTGTTSTSPTPTPSTSTSSSSRGRRRATVTVDASTSSSSTDGRRPGEPSDRLKTRTRSNAHSSSTTYSSSSSSTSTSSSSSSSTSSTSSTSSSTNTTPSAQARELPPPVSPLLPLELSPNVQPPAPPPEPAPLSLSAPRLLVKPSVLVGLLPARQNAKSVEFKEDTDEEIDSEIDSVMEALTQQHIEGRAPTGATKADPASLLTSAERRMPLLTAPPPRVSPELRASLATGPSPASSSERRSSLPTPPLSSSAERRIAAHTHGVLSSSPLSSSSSERRVSAPALASSGERRLSAISMGSAGERRSSAPWFRAEEASPPMRRSSHLARPDSPTPMLTPTPTPRVLPADTDAALLELISEMSDSSSESTSSTPPSGERVSPREGQ